MRSRSIPLREVYVWEFPVRLYHWINALCITSLCITGYIIGDPPALMKGTEAYFNYWFGTVRFVHFVSAFLFFFNFVFRTYWGFVGNEFSRWYNYIPLKPSQWKEIIDVIKVDVLQVTHKRIGSIGHNALASFVYFITFLIFVFQCLTGFGMYSAMSNAFLPNLFAWIVPVLGGDILVRQIHHILMWGFILFTIVHVYLVFYHDYIERRGVTSSMIGGWKFIEEDIVDSLDENTNDKTKK
ncbi:MAG: Ni/Fe-hydrogenase, b-type cytochrome subunit [Bacteroidales bacterium]|nr:Ni/Fe-hydrogenase, b-type cytochrome subunit [Bacteroidales bacterium]